jgi:hypothetical protein
MESQESGECSRWMAVRGALRRVHIATAKEVEKKGLANRPDEWRPTDSVNLCLQGNIPKHAGMV